MTIAPEARPAWLSSTPRILIVKLSAVGDVVHAMPALGALRKAYPGAKLGWAVHPGVANLLQHHPQIDELIVVPRGIHGIFPRVISRLHGRGGWDCAIDFQGLTKSGLAARLSGAHKRIGFAGPNSREFNRFFMNMQVEPTHENVIQQNMDLLKPLGIEDAPAEANMHCAAEDYQKIRNWAKQVRIEGERFVVMDPFAGWPSKVWKNANWVELAWLVKQACGTRPLVFFGPGEQESGNKLAWEMRTRGCSAVVAPQTTLREYIALLRLHATGLVGGDTGPMHIAAAAGIPTVALYGASDSRRNAPAFANAKYEVLQDFGQPCAGTFERRCPYHKEPGQCLSSIEPRKVLEALKRVLA